MRKAADQLLLERKDQKEVDDLVGLLSHSVDPKTKRALTLTEQRDNLIGFFIVGHETSALALTWALYLIGSHPKTQQRILDEIRDVLGDEDIKFEYISQLKFVNAVLNEALRLFPPIPILGREAIGDTQVLDTVIRKDEIVVIPLYVMHRSSVYWDNPNSFDPDRFLREPKLERNALQFKPFGDGPRVCIGASLAIIEAVMAIVTIVRKFEIQIDCENIKPQVTASLRPSGNIKASFIERKS
jgi:cytochrome P450